MDTNLASLIDSAASVLVLLPDNSTFDNVSAGLGLYLSVFDRKPVTISCSSPMMVGFNRIIGINRITADIGNKNLLIKFRGYDAANIEKVSYDIIEGEFNLTVVPKTGLIAPTKEQMDISFTGLSADLIVLVGGTSESDFPILTSPELSVSKIAHISNHSFNSKREVLSFAKPGSGISEVVANLIKELSLTIDRDIATNLVMGIEDASSNFGGSDVTPDTFETFAWLLRNGGSRQSMIKLSPVGFPPGAIPTQPFNRPLAQQAPQSVVHIPGETDAIDAQGTGETEQEINPPDDWLKPKVFQGATPLAQPDAFSENKG